MLEPFTLDEFKVDANRVYWDDEAVQNRYAAFLSAESITNNGLREVQRFRENGLYMFSFDPPPKRGNSICDTNVLQSYVLGIYYYNK